MRCFRCDLKTKLKDAYALRFLGDPSMFHFLFTAFEQEVLHLPILKKHVHYEISDILSEQANMDEIYRGNIERNITQISRGYAENLYGFSNRLRMVGLSPKQSIQFILKHNAATYLEDEMSKCAVLIEYKNQAP